MGLDVWSTMHTHTTAPPLLPLPYPRGVLRYRLQRQATGASIARSKRTADQSLKLCAYRVNYCTVSLRRCLVR